MGEVGTPLGIIEQPELPEVQLELAPGDLLAFYTDGVSEAAAPRKLLSEEELAALVAERAADGPRAVVEHLESTAVALAGGNPRDDIACLAVQVTTAAAGLRALRRRPGTPRATSPPRSPRSTDELGDRMAQDLRLLATELVANAVRHTGVAGGTVEVELRVDRRPRAPERARRRPGLRAAGATGQRARRARAAGACTSSTAARCAGGASAESATACGWNWSVSMPPETAYTAEPLGPGTTAVAVAGEVTFSNVVRLRPRARRRRSTRARGTSSSTSPA